MHSWDANKIFKLLPFYDSYIERPRVKKLSSVQLLREIPLYDLHLVVMPEVIKLKLLIKEM